MKHYFQAEQLKYRHTSVAAITFGMPVFTALLAFWLTSSYFSIDVYNWWYIGLYPGFLGILCSIIGKKDKQKKNYTIWSLPCGMEQIWDAKISSRRREQPRRASGGGVRPGDVLYGACDGKHRAARNGRAAESRGPRCNYSRG